MKMIKQLRWVILIILVLTLVSCNRAIPELFPDDPDQRPVSVYVVSHGWHVGIAVPLDSTFAEKLGGMTHADDYAWAEIGWGDRDYYMDTSPGIWTTFKAAVWPTRSTVHISAFDRDMPDRFSGQRMVEVQISVDGYKKLLERIDRTLAKDDDGNPVDIGAGRYGDARFYASDRRYFLPRTSNTWIAALLREAGAPITPWVAWTSGNVIRQSRGFGELIE